MVLNCSSPKNDAIFVFAPDFEGYRSRREISNGSTRLNKYGIIMVAVLDRILRYLV